MDLLLTMGQGVLGGLLLNVMPCVFPVLLFKLNGLIAQGDATPAARRIDALGYLLGTLLSFAAFAALVIALRAGGRSLGWGMQMQNPTFVAAIIVLLFTFGLNALGVFQLEFSIGGSSRRGGLVSSMVDGGLITLVSTPCSAPILGGATAAALARDAHWLETLSLFWSIGFGLALPVMLIALVPVLHRRLPRPGPWMEGMKMLVAFSLLAAAIWFFETLQLQVTVESANHFLYFLLALGGVLGLWQVFKSKGWSRPILWSSTLSLVAILGLGAHFFVRFEPRKAEAAGPAIAAGESSVRDGKLHWTPYSEALIKEANARGQAVFVDFTAEWCATCKTFERTHINTPSVRAAFDETRVLAMKADLTSYESDLWDVLAGFGRSGLPTYAFYLPDGRTEVLPEGPPLNLDKKLVQLSGQP